METGHTLLVVDDDPTVRGLIRDAFAGQDYHVLEAGSAPGARELLGSSPPDLVLLDVGLPGEDGLSLARHIREHLDIPIIMVSGAGDSIDRVIGLEVGADDYVAKPFNPRELQARVKSVLRRYRRSPAETETIPAGANGLGDLRLDLAGRRLLAADGREISLTRMEFDLLQVFVERPGRALSRDQLLNLTQHRDWDPFDRSIDIRVARLRRKLQTGDGQPEVIRTVRGIGYMFVPRPD